MCTEERIDLSGFFSRYRAVSLRFLRGWIPRHDVAEDVFQESARALLERLERGAVAFQSPAHIRNYFFRIMKNLAVNVLRDAGARRARRLDTALGVADGTQDPLEKALRNERSLAQAGRVRAVGEAIEALEPAEREALGLRYREALHYREMAERTGAAVSTLQSRVESALEKIRKSIGKKGTAL